MIKAVFVCGPTASGKTEYAIRLAKDLNGEIVSADSMQIYRFMDIGSAKPTAEELAQVPHHLVGTVDPGQTFSAADYREQALSCIKDIASRGKLPVISGGTGLYISSLIYDMEFSAPEGSREVRDEILKRYDSDPDRLHERLKELDPAAAEEIHRNNIKRTVRAIERLECGEDTLARYTDQRKPSPFIFPVLIGLNRDREELYERCELRVHGMFEEGLENEVRSLMAMGLTAENQSMKGIGYKEVIKAIEAGLPAESAMEEIIVSTRHYAKRQFTWLRQYENMKWFTLSGRTMNDDVYGEILDHVRNTNP